MVDQFNVLDLSLFVSALVFLAFDKEYFLIEVARISYIGVKSLASRWYLNYKIASDCIVRD